MTDRDPFWCECGNPKTPRAQGCDHCNAIDTQRTSADSPIHIVTRALRWQGDWTASWALWDAMDAESHTFIGARLSWAIMQLVDKGIVLKRKRNGRNEYKLASLEQRKAA
jgi:hypothetical protein